MTPDGISSEDWDRIHELALSVVNTGDPVLKSEHKRHLLHALDLLEERYGELPSILATRADYLDETAQKLLLLQRAYELAVGKQDERNSLFVASSIADLYYEDLQDREEALRWLRVAQSHLAVGSAVDKELCDDLEAAIERDARGEA